MEAATTMRAADDALRNAMKDARGNRVSSWRYYTFPSTHATRSKASTSARAAYNFLKGHIAKIAAVCEALAKKDVADSTELLNAAEKLVAAIDVLVVAFQASNVVVQDFENVCFKKPKYAIYQARREKLAALQHLQGKLRGILQRMVTELTSGQALVRGGAPAPLHENEITIVSSGEEAPQERRKGEKRCQELREAEQPSAEATPPFLTPCSSAASL